MELRAQTKHLSRLDRQRKWEEALIYFRKLPRHDTILYNTVLSACAREGGWLRCLQLLMELESARLRADTVTHNAMISSCEKSTQWTKALSFFEALERREDLKASLISYSAAASACQKATEWQAALWLFARSQLQSLRPDLVFCSAVCAACSNWQLTLELLDLGLQLQGGSKKVLFSSALSACESGGQWRVALEVFKRQVAMSIRADEVTYCAVMSCYQRASHWQTCVMCLESLRWQGLRQSSVARNVATSACAERWRLALATFTHDVVGCGAALNALGLRWAVALALLPCGASAVLRTAAAASCVERWAVALQLLEGHGHGGHGHDVRLSTAVIRASACCIQWQVALHLVPQVPLDAKTANCALNACMKATQWQSGIELLDSLRRRELELDLILLSMAADASELAGEVTHFVDQLVQLDQVCGRNLRKKEVNGCKMR